AGKLAKAIVGEPSGRPRAKIVRGPGPVMVASHRGVFLRTGRRRGDRVRAHRVCGSRNGPAGLSILASQKEKPRFLGAFGLKRLDPSLAPSALAQDDRGGFAAAVTSSPSAPSRRP